MTLSREQIERLVHLIDAEDLPAQFAVRKFLQVEFGAFVQAPRKAGIPPRELLQMGKVFREIGDALMTHGMVEEPTGYGDLGRGDGVAE